jgi:hypothetical protein
MIDYGECSIISAKLKMRSASAGKLHFIHLSKQRNRLGDKIKSDWTIWLVANTRFRVLGKFKADAFGVGVWFEVDRIEQLTLEHPFRLMKAWEIKPPTCLIRWGDIAYIQEGRSPSQIGFVPMKK